jgi:hypothetical protein
MYRAALVLCGILVITTLNQTVQSVTAIASALVASNAQHIELADQISKDDCTVAGHSCSPNRRPNS